MIFTVTADTLPLQRLLDRMQIRVSGMGLSNWLRYTMRPFLVERIGERFDNEGDDAAGRWADLASNTGRIRAAQGFPALHPINVRTGQMRRHLESSHSITAMATTPTLNIPARNSPAMAKKVRMAQVGGSSSGKSRFIGPHRSAPPRPVLALNSTDLLFAQRSLMEFITMGGHP